MPHLLTLPLNTLSTPASQACAPSWGRAQTTVSCSTSTRDPSGCTSTPRNSRNSRNGRRRMLQPHHPSKVRPHLSRKAWVSGQARVFPESAGGAGVGAVWLSGAAQLLGVPSTSPAAAVPPPQPPPSASRRLPRGPRFPPCPLPTAPPANSRCRPSRP